MSMRRQARLSGRSPPRPHMAKRPKNLVGLDIDPSGITAAQVSVNGRISIDRAAFSPLEPGIVRDGEITDVEGLADALRTLFKENKGLGKRVRVGVANQKIVVRTMELPYLEDHRELATAVRFHAGDQLPMPMDQAVIDFQPLEVVDGPDGRRQRLLVVAARRDMVERVVAAVRAAGLRPEGVDLSAFAMIRALYRPDPQEDLVLYLAVGGMTNLAVAKGTRCLFTRGSGGGVEALAIELAETAELTLDHARGWLEHVGLQAAVEDIDGDEEIVTKARRLLIDGARRIAAEVRNSLDFHHAQGGEAHVARAVLTGPAAAIPGFEIALSAELGLPVTLAAVDSTPDGLSPGRVAIAAGLAVEEVAA
ncbi:MAG: type pilus assembly protein PilM [bacterium]|jgi:type IV pilus assembly protein PilM|nr:type pilus assembly protein PilM [Solirubrobacteraceae bacterium]